MTTNVQIPDPPVIKHTQVLLYYFSIVEKYDMAIVGTSLQCDFYKLYLFQTTYFMLTVFVSHKFETNIYI